MSDIEKTKPIDVLATRVWSGTHWHYPHIEAMIAEIERLRAENERWQEIVRDEMDETFALYEVMGITDTIKDGTAPTRAITDKAQDMQAELARLRKLYDAAWAECEAWRSRHDAMRGVGALPYPWPALDEARLNTDTARKESTNGNA